MLGPYITGFFLVERNLISSGKDAILMLHHQTQQLVGVVLPVSAFTAYCIVSGSYSWRYAMLKSLQVSLF
jgi:hypothetical protein